MKRQIKTVSARTGGEVILSPLQLKQGWVSPGFPCEYASTARKK
jgi:hypothetical protein